MKYTVFFMAFALGAHSANAQQWEIHIAAGASTGKLLPKGMSTAQNAQMRYGMSGRGTCFSPEVAVKVSDYSRFSFAYQLALTPSGIQYKPQGHRGPKQASSDAICLQSALLGYSYRTMLPKAGLQFGGFAKAGLAYGTMYEIKESGGSGFSEIPQGYYMSGRRLTEFEVMPDFWTPVSSLGFIIGPYAQNRKLADRLCFTVSATMMWKDPYTSYSRSQYSYISGSKVVEEVVQFKGNSMLFQVCADYNLFTFRSKVRKT